MTAPITWGGESVGNSKNTTWGLSANPFGESRLLAGAINCNLCGATAAYDYTLTMGALLNYNSVLATTGTQVLPTVPNPINQNWISGQAFIVDAVILTSASSITTAHGALFSLAGGTGVTIVSDVALSTLTGAAAGSAGSAFVMTLADTTTYYTATSLFFRVGTRQAATGTLSVDVYVFGKVLP